MEPSNASRWPDWLWLVVCGIASSVWCVSTAGQLGATFDEPLYIKRGLERWRTGSHSGLMQLGTMPLPVDLATLPLYLYERWQGIPLDPEADLEVILPWARAGTLVFWWLLLIYGWRTAASLGGPWAGRLAAAILAVEPNLLAHASLATTDIAVGACLLGLVYHFRTNRESGWARRVAIPACWFAAAVLAKASGLVFGPLCLAVVEIERLVRERAKKKAESGGQQAPARGRLFPFSLFLSPSPFWRDCIQIGVLGIVMVFVYCGSDWQPQTSFVNWAKSLPDGPQARAIVWLSENLRVFSNAGEGLVRQIRHNIRSHGGAYILGEWRPRAFWYYFPVALTIKLTVPLLILPIVLAIIRPRSLANWACLTAAVLVLFSLTCRVQTGIRFMLPLVVLGVIGLAAAVAHTNAAFGPGWRRSLLGGGTVAGFLWMLGSTIAVWPNGLCYTNELWGGTPRGYERLSGSNYDWGQGLPELARWQNEHSEADVDVWYFGTDPALKRLSLREMPLHTLAINGPEDVLTRVRGHYLAVSTTLYCEFRGSTVAAQRAAAFIFTRRPMARTTTYLIYDFTKD